MYSVNFISVKVMLHCILFFQLCCRVKIMLWVVTLLFNNGANAIRSNLSICQKILKKCVAAGKQKNQYKICKGATRHYLPESSSALRRQEGPPKYVREKGWMIFNVFRSSDACLSEGRLYFFVQFLLWRYLNRNHRNRYTFLTGFLAALFQPQFFGKSNT